jgi:raffinose/stachyose/melibiose transport system permease protein
MNRVVISSSISTIVNAKGIDGKRNANIAKKKSKALLIYLVLGVFAAMYIVPMLVLMNVSFKTSQEYLMDPTSLTNGLHFQNYIDAWRKANFPQYLGNTILYTVLSTIIYSITVLLVAFPIARKYVKGSNFIYTLFVIGLFLPSGLIPQFQLILGMHLYNTQLGYILLTVAGDIGVILLVGYLQSLPKDLDEAAALEGCNYFQFIYYIVFPLIKPALATIALLHAIGIWNDLIGPTIYLTKKAYYPITRGLLIFYGQYGNNWPPLAAATIMMIIPMIIAFLVMQRYFIDGALAGAIKG